MKKSYIPVVIDTAFFSLISFFFFLSLLFRAVKMPFSVVFSATLSGLFAVAVFYALFNRKSKAVSAKKQKELSDLTLFQLAFMKKNEITDMLHKAFDKTGKIYRKNGNRFYFPDENTVLYHSFGVEGASKTDVLRLFNTLKPEDTGKIICADANKETEEFCERFNGKVVLIKGDKAYAFLKKFDALPEITVAPLKTDQKKFDFNGLLNKKRAKNYFVFGLFFAVMSFIVKFKLYYTIAGCAFFTLAAIAVVFGKTNVKEK